MTSGTVQALGVDPGGVWRDGGDARATANPVDRASFASVVGDAVRLQVPTRFGGQDPTLAELVGRPGPG
jgi:hypothetical protein